MRPSEVGGTYLSLCNKNSDLIFLENFTRKGGRGRSTERKSSQSQWKELSHSRELIFERKKEKKRGEEEQQPQKCARRRVEDEALNPAS